MNLTRERVEAGHTRRFTVTRSDGGWQVREERDSETVRLIRFTDWHRVERALDAFERAESRSTASPH